MSYFAYMVPHSVAPLLWGHVEPLIQRAVVFANNEIDMSIIKDSIFSDQMGLLVIIKDGVIHGAITMKRSEYEGGKVVLHVGQIAGDGLEEWIDIAVNAIKDIARRLGLDEIYGIGRAGWGKVLADYGFRPVYTTFSCKLEDLE